jgi:hypothetical protein
MTETLPLTKPSTSSKCCDVGAFATTCVNMAIPSRPDDRNVVRSNPIIRATVVLRVEDELLYSLVRRSYRLRILNQEY